MPIDLKLTLVDGRVWFLSSDLEPDSSAERLGACMLVSERDVPLSAAQVVAEWVIAKDCLAISVVAPNAHPIHDLLDAILEDREAYGVVTTAESDPHELENTIAMVSANLSDAKNVFVHTDVPQSVEAGLRALGLLA